jgi:hypothetical protein
VRCESCGYTEDDAKLHGDHRLCKNDGNAPWQKKQDRPWSSPEVQGDLDPLVLLRALQEIRSKSGPGFCGIGLGELREIADRAINQYLGLAETGDGK